MAENNNIQREVVIKTSLENAVNEGVQAVNNSLKGLDTGIKSFKQQVKETREQLLALAAAGKQNTAEFAAATRQLAELRDMQGEVNAAVNAYNPDSKFEGLGKLAGLAANSLGALQGSMVLLGISSDSAQESIAKLQAVQGLTGLITSFADAKDILVPFLQRLGLLKTTTAAITTATNAQTAATASSVGVTQTATVASNGLSTAMKSIPIVLLISGIILLITKFDAIKDVVLKFLPGLKAMGDFFTSIIQTVTDFVGITSDATRALDKLTKATARNNEMIDYQIQRLEAQGGKEAEVYKLKEKRINAELNLLRNKLKVEGKLSEDEQKNFKKLKVDAEVEAIKESKRLEDNSKKLIADQKAKHEKLLEQQKAAAEKVKAATEAERKLVADAIKEANKTIEQNGKTAHEKDVEDTRTKYQQLIDLAIKNGQDTIVLQDAMNTELSDKQKKNDEEVAKAKKESAEKLQKESDERFKALNDARLLNVENANRPSENDTPEEAENKLRNIEEAKYIALADAFERRKEQLAGQNEELALLTAEYEASVLDITTKASEDRKAVEEAERNTKLQNMQIVAGGLQTLGSVFGEQTAAYKSLASAGALIDAYGAINKILNTPSTIPEPFGSIQKGVSAAAIGLNAMKQVKSINSVKVPGKSGSSASSAPLFNSAPVINSRVLNDTGVQDVRVTDTKSQAPIKAYLVEKDLDSKEKEKAFVDRVSRI